MNNTYPIGKTLTFYAQTSRFSTGEAYDAGSVPTYRVYEEETGTPILTGSMALLDDSNTTGFYSEQITLSTANGFEAGKDYCIRVTATVDSVAAASIAEKFTMELPWNDTALVTEFTGNPTTLGQALRRILEVFKNRWTVSANVGTLYGADNSTPLVTQGFSYNDTGSDRSAQS